MTGRRVTVRVGRLSVPPHLARDAGALQSALRAEIASALRETGVSRPVSQSIAAIDAGTVESPSAQFCGTRIGEFVAKRTLT